MAEPWQSEGPCRVVVDFSDALVKGQAAEARHLVWGASRWVFSRPFIWPPRLLAGNEAGRALLITGTGVRFWTLSRARAAAGAGAATTETKRSSLLGRHKCAGKLVWPLHQGQPLRAGGVQERPSIQYVLGAQFWAAPATARCPRARRAWAPADPSPTGLAARTAKEPKTPKQAWDRLMSEAPVQLQRSHGVFLRPKDSSSQ